MVGVEPAVKTLYRNVAPSMKLPTLDYAHSRREPLSLWRVFVWLTPLWTAGIVGLHCFFDGGDDLYWWAAIGFAALVGVACVHRHRLSLALYCFAIVIVILLISALLPSVNRARVNKQGRELLTLAPPTNTTTDLSWDEIGLKKGVRYTKRWSHLQLARFASLTATAQAPTPVDEKSGEGVKNR